MSAWLSPEPALWWQTVEDAYAEDLGSGDVTAGCFSRTHTIRYYIEAQAEGVLSGVGVAEHLLAPLGDDPDAHDLVVLRRDGEFVRRGDRIVEGAGYASRILGAERTVLNFLMHLSGVASLTHQFVQKVEGTGARICDTRKTIPMMRALQKYAVRCGGGWNHRMGLFDGAMVKDNHIRACGSITEAVKRLRTYLSHMTKIEVEVETLAQAEEAVQAGVDIILLDNMDPFMMREAVKRYKGRVILEASGGISLDTVRGVAQTGVDLISVGALTHSAVSLPLHMEFE